MAGICRQARFATELQTNTHAACSLACKAIPERLAGRL